MWTPCVFFTFYFISTSCGNDQIRRRVSFSFFFNVQCFEFWSFHVLSHHYDSGSACSLYSFRFLMFILFHPWVRYSSAHVPGFNMWLDFNIQETTCLLFLKNIPHCLKTLVHLGIFVIYCIQSLYGLPACSWFLIRFCQLNSNL